MEPRKSPHPAWYLAHVFLGLLSGLVVYVLYHERNYEAARRHLVVSLALTVLSVGAGAALMWLFGW